MDKVHENGKTPERTSVAALTLEGLGSHDYVRIDGETYDLADFDMLGIRDRARAVRYGQRIGEISRLGEDASEDDDREYAARCRELASMALPTAAADVLDQLARGQTEAIAMTFFEQAPRSALAKFAEKRMQQEPTISDSSSPTSSAPTAVIP